MSVNDGKRIVNTNVNTISEDWFESILNDPEVYDELIAENLNIILSFEYYKFKSLLENKQIYGCLFQVKDIYEILLRLPVLIVASIILEKKETSKFEKKFLINITLKRHTLGTWRGLLKSAYDLTCGYDESLKHLHLITKETYEFSNAPSGTDNIDLVNWRNKYVGHGPLMLDSNPKLYEDIKIRLSQITAFLHKIKSNYTHITFHNNNSYTSPLIGYKSVDKISNDMLFMKIGEFGKYRPLSFIRVFENGIYLYDSFVQKRNLVDMVEYYEGKREMFHTTDFKDIMDNTTTTSNYSIDDKSFSVEEQRISDMILNIDDYVEPTPLINWINGITNKTKSVSMVQIGKGMGKSTFVRALDPFAMDKIHLPHLEVKTYYINPYFGSRLYTFSQQLHSVMTKKSTGEEMQCDFQQLNTEIHSKTPEEEFAHMINKAKNSDYEYNKLLIVIDGLDELRKQPGYNIVDFIPNNTELIDEDIHILITSRTTSNDDDLSDYALECLNKFKDVEKFTIEIDSEEYNEMKRRYLEEMLFKKYSKILKTKEINFELTRNDKNKIFETMKSQSLLYLKQYKEISSIRINEQILVGEKDVNADIFNIDQNILEEYFNLLQVKSGTKYYKKFVQIIMVFILTNDFLTIQELSVFVENGTPSFAFLGFINTIRMFLTAKRSSKGNKLGISHLENVVFLKSYLNDEFCDVINDVFSKVKLFTTPSEIDYEDNQAMLLLAYFDQLVYQAEEKKIEEYNEIEEYYLELLSNVKLNQHWSLTESQIEWAIMFYQGLKTFYEKQKGKETSDFETKYFASYINVLTMLGFFYYVKRYTKDSLMYLEKSYELASDIEFSDEDTYQRYTSFNSVTLFSYNVEGGIENGFKMIETAKNKLEDLKKSGYLIRPQNEGELLKNLATCSKGINDFPKALQYYKQAIPKYYVCQSDDDIWELAHVLVLTGHCAMELGLYEESEEYLLMSKEIRDRLIIETGYDRAYTGISRNLKFLGNNSFKNKKYNEALQYFTELVDYLEGVQTDLKLTNKTHYFEALYFKAESLYYMGSFDNARSCLESGFRYHTSMDHEEKAKKDNLLFFMRLNDLKELVDKKINDIKNI